VKGLRSTEDLPELWEDSEAAAYGEDGEGDVPPSDRALKGEWLSAPHPLPTQHNEGDVGEDEVDGKRPVGSEPRLLLQNVEGDETPEERRWVLGRTSTSAGPVSRPSSR
jgi:hypothetical protein